MNRRFRGVLLGLILVGFCMILPISLAVVPELDIVSSIAQADATTSTTTATSTGLVPCGGTGQEPCQACHVVGLAQNIIGWLVGFMSVVAAIIFVYSGAQMIVSGGNQHAIEQAKSRISNIFIGYALLLAGWLLIDTGMKALVNDSTFGVWNQVQCVKQPDPVWVGNWEPHLTASGANAVAFSEGDVTLNVAAIGNAGSVLSMVQTAGQSAGLSAAQLKVFTALIQQESSMCRNMQSPAGALGCGQLMLGTAKGLDPSATANRLLNDNQYNLALSARFFAMRLQATGGDMRSTLASYNGGAGALAPSRDCPGMKKWECTINPGGYVETQHYVANILAMAGRL